MSFKRTFGRCLLVMICVISAISKFTNTKPSEKLLTEGYSKTFAKAKEFGVVLPLAPQVLSLYITEIIQLTAGLLILGSVLVIFNKSLGGWILGLLLVSFNVIIHNPMLYPKEADWVKQVTSGLLNLGTIAGLCLACEAKTNGKEKVD